MSAGSSLAVVLALSAGLTGSVQAAVMGKLGERIGIFEALAFSTATVGTAIAGNLVMAAVPGWCQAL